MSSERTLAGWIEALVVAVDLDPLRGGARLRELAGERRASIGLDGETVVVGFVGDDLTSDLPGAVHGEGHTTSDVVVGILSSTLEATDAVEAGLIQVRGATEDVVRLFAIVELLLDASSRVPELRELAEAFLTTHATVGAAAVGVESDNGPELHLLNRLGLGG